MPARPAQLPNREGRHPLAYFLTFTTYGTWLHGDERGSVDRAHATFESPTVRPNRLRQGVMRSNMAHSAITLGPRLRAVVEDSIRDKCNYRGWILEALAVRTNHVHVVVGASERPERILSDIKAWATRRCRAAGLIGEAQAMWTRHGSTRYLWTERAIENACRYVVEGQGAELPRLAISTWVRRGDPTGR